MFIKLFTLLQAKNDNEHNFISKSTNKKRKCDWLEGNIIPTTFLIKGDDIIDWRISFMNRFCSFKNSLTCHSHLSLYLSDPFISISTPSSSSSRFFLLSILSRLGETLKKVFIITLEVFKSSHICKKVTYHFSSLQKMD